MASNNYQAHETINMSLIRHEIEEENKFVTRTKTAVIDTTCSKTIVGLFWYENFLKNLSIADQERIKINPSKTLFKYFDGSKMRSLKRVTFPVIIAGTNCRIEAELVEEDIPLLLSKQSLKKAGTVIDIKNNKAIMFNRVINLHISDTGHYCIDIHPQEECIDRIISNIFIEPVVSSNSQSALPTQQQKQKKSHISKIREQLSYAGINQLQKLIKSANQVGPEFTRLFEDVLNTCEKFIKPINVAMPDETYKHKTTAFNEVVSVELQFIEPFVWCLEITDDYTKYCNGGIIKNERLALNVYLKQWVSLFGAPVSISLGRVGETFKREIVEICHCFDTKIINTAQFSSWNYNQCDATNPSLTSLLLRVPNSLINNDWDAALTWAICTKNSLSNINGSSPSQMVFGNSDNLHRTLSLKIAPSEGMTKNVEKHTAVINTIRKLFAKTDLNKPISRKASRTRLSANYFDIGDMVYYINDDRTEWNGPAFVLGQDGLVMYLEQGTRRIKVNVNQVKLIEQVTEHVDKRL